MPAPTFDFDRDPARLHLRNDELHALNAELHAANEELCVKIAELTCLNDDLDNLIAATDIGTIFLDQDGRIRRHSPAAVHSVRIGAGDIGRRIFDLPRALDYPEFDDDLLMVLNGGPALEREAPRDDGRVMLARIRPYRSRRTQLAGAVVTFVDVTRLSIAEKRLQIYINSLPHQVAVIDSAGMIKLVNAAWMRFATENGGRPDKVGIGANYLSACRDDPEISPIINGLLAVLAGQATSFQFEYPCHSPTRLRWFIMTVAPIEGGAGGAVISHIDISDRKQSEKDLRLAASVFANSGEGIVITDCRERIVSVNRAFCETTGFASEEVIGQRPRIFLSHHRDSIAPQTMWGSLTEGGIWRGEAWIRRRDGKPFPSWLTISRVADADGRVRNHVAIFSDLSERKESEHRLLEINAELEQFAYVASHDLREPLRMVASYLRMIERRLGSDLDGEVREFLNFAIDGARRMDLLILDLLEYSRIGRTGRQPAPVAVAVVIDRAVAILRVAIAEAGATVTTAAAGLTAQIDADDGLRVVQNLIANALKYCPPDRRPDIAITARQNGEMITVEVTDNGIGIPDSQFDRIFRMFQRLHGRDDYGGGTGIGLAICKKSVERMGGTLWVQSVPGQGSTFGFTMPAAAPCRLTTVSLTESPKPSQDGKG